MYLIFFGRNSKLSIQTLWEAFKVLFFWFDSLNCNFYYKEFIAKFYSLSIMVSYGGRILGNFEFEYRQRKNESCAGWHLGPIMEILLIVQKPGISIQRHFHRYKVIKKSLFKKVKSVVMETWEIECRGCQNSFLWPYWTKMISTQGSRSSFSIEKFSVKNAWVFDGKKTSSCLWRNVSSKT